MMNEVKNKMFQLIRNSLEDEMNPKKISYEPFVFIIDESGCHGGEFRSGQVEELARKFSFEVTVKHLSNVFEGFPEEEAVTRLKDLLAQAPDQTARATLMKDLRRHLILKVADSMNCKKVFTGECATSLAITLLSGKKNLFARHMYE